MFMVLHYFCLASGAKNVHPPFSNWQVSEPDTSVGVSLVNSTSCFCAALQRVSPKPGNKAYMAVTLLSVQLFLGNSCAYSNLFLQFSFFFYPPRYCFQLIIPESYTCVTGTVVVLFSTLDQLTNQPVSVQCAEIYSIKKLPAT